MKCQGQDSSPRIWGIPSHPLPIHASGRREGLLSLHLRRAELEQSGGKHMLNIRAEAPGDEGAIYAVNQLAFSGEAEPRLVDAIRRSDCFIPALSLVAEEDGAVVGHILVSRVGVQTESGLAPALALAPLAVHPDRQNRGIGGALVRAALGRARALGHDLVIVLGHPGYYPRFGFRLASEFGLECPFPGANEAFMALALQTGERPRPRGLVAYPPAFDEV